MHCDMQLIPPGRRVFTLRLYAPGRSRESLDPYEWCAIAVVGEDGIPEVELVDKPLTIDGRRALREAFKRHGFHYWRRVHPGGRVSKCRV